MPAVGLWLDLKGSPKSSVQHWGSWKVTGCGALYSLGVEPRVSSRLTVLLADVPQLQSVPEETIWKGGFCPQLLPSPCLLAATGGSCLLVHHAVLPWTKPSVNCGSK